ncbi:hypothetical protein CHS0354_023463 [Potamilus streckersoni]|uniref:Transmembrane protein 229A n=1 Tax=Potamilus streckersoni TaxID=2493646 RepID=A0AAE0VNM3_9BIVA|nr:hypothetical protein CHS0354_023463 [Potamilus streckersoni]
MATTQQTSLGLPLPAWARFYFYGMHGLLDEILFTAIFDMVFESTGNRQLKGYSSVFSFFIYGSCSFLVERLYVFLYLQHGIRWYIRLPLYLLVLYLWEFTWGLTLRQFGACSWDYSHYKYNLMGLVTLEYAPAWLILCYFQDVLSDFLLSLQIRISGRQEKEKKQF